MNKEQLKTPCFIIDEDEFVRNIQSFKRKLDVYFEKSIIGYSFKTNSLPRLVQLAKENGCWAEVVSEDEYNLAKKIGFQCNHIIYNGPVKEKESFFDALYNDSVINIDSDSEIEWLETTEIPCIKNVGIRVNFDLESELPGQTSTGSSGGRFGYCYENGELKKVISRIRAINNIKIDGLHMHVSNASKSVEVYEKLADMACKIALEEKLNISYIDLGGGYFGGGDDGIAYEKYIEAIYKVLKGYNMDNVRLIVEPGASVVATSFSYLTSVVDIKKTTYGRFVVTDGTRLHIDPFLKKNKYAYKVNCNNEHVVKQQIICGYTCMENDRIMTLCNQNELSKNDIIEYTCMGSYTMCFNQLFISYLPKVYSKRSGQFEIVREKWSVEEYIQKNRWIL